MNFFSSHRVKTWILLIFLSFSWVSWGAMNLGAQHYTIDSKNSHFFVYTDTAGIFGGLGHKHKIAIPGFSGDVTFDPADLSKSSLNMTLLANSLSLVTDTKKEEEDKSKIEENMQTKVLEISTFPNINFRSKEISVVSTGSNEFDASIKGDLILHGITRNLLVPAKI